MLYASNTKKLTSKFVAKQFLHIFWPASYTAQTALERSVGVTAPVLQLKFLAGIDQTSNTVATRSFLQDAKYSGHSSAHVRFFFMLLGGGWGIVGFTGRAMSGSFYPLLSRFLVNSARTGGSALANSPRSIGGSVVTNTYLFSAQFQ